MKSNRLEVQYDYGEGWCAFAGFYDESVFLRKAKMSLKRGRQMFPNYKFRLMVVAPDGIEKEIS